MLYYTGEGVLQDYTEAGQWVRKAAYKGLTRAHAMLGIMYMEGRGVPLDNVYAYAWFNVAAAGGDRESSKGRDAVARKMIAAQVAEAQNLSRELFEKYGKK